jgi:hypothetical protein
VFPTEETELSSDHVQDTIEEPPVLEIEEPETIEEDTEPDIILDEPLPFIEQVEEELEILEDLALPTEDLSTQVEDIDAAAEPFVAYEEEYDEAVHEPEEQYVEYEEEYEEEIERSLFSQLSAIKVPLVVIIIGSLLSGALMGILIYPTEDTSNLQERYDALYGYYSEIQEQNQELNSNLDELTIELNTLQNDYDDLADEYSSLNGKWSSIFSDQTQYQAPSLNTINTFITTDTTDQMTHSSTFTPVDQAILFSLIAKTQNIRAGVVTINGNFTEEVTEYTYNVIVTNEGITVYIDPQTDEIWWSEDYEEVTANQIWDLGDYTSVYVTEITTIIDH